MLGRGGMGVVWLVRDRERQQEFALKRVTDLRPEQLRRFKNGFRALQHIGHPGLARMIELGQDDEGLYLLMEPVFGLDLLAYVREPGDISFTPSRLPREDHDTSTSVVFDVTAALKEVVGPDDVDTGRLRLRPDPDHAPLTTARVDNTQTIKPTKPTASPEHPPDARPASRPPLNAVRLAHVLPQLLEALAVLHANGHVHRDLKPRNVLVDGTGTLKLLDFGVVAESGRPLRDNLCGTIGYIPPEEYTGASPTPASDRYALGAILFRMYSGRAPFEGSRPEILRQTLRRSAPRLGEVAPWTPPAIATLVDRLLSRDPAERPGLDEVALVFRHTLASRDLRHDPAPPTPLLVRDGAEATSDLEPLLGVARQPAGRRLVVVAGRIGGLTPLSLHHLQQAAERKQWAVLVGRASHRDRVPFSAIDGVVDALSVDLRDRDGAPLSPEVRAARTILGARFPVLRDKPGAPGRLPRRLELMRALRAALVHLTTLHPGVLILLHDLHLVDTDCELLLEALVRELPPGVLVVASCPEDSLDPASPTPAIPFLRRFLQVEPELARIHRPTPPGPAEIAERVAASLGEPWTAGHPDVQLLAHACLAEPARAEVVSRLLAADALPSPDHDPWLAWVRSAWPRLSSTAMQILGLLAAARSALSVDQLRRASRQPPGAIDEALDQLRNLALIGLVGLSRTNPSVQLASPDLIDPVRSVQPPEMHDACVSALIDVLQRDPAPDLEQLALLLREAGRLDEACTMAAEAAAEAKHRLAWGLAAERYSEAVRVAPDALRANLLQERALCLELMGRYAAAAEDWARVATDPNASPTIVDDAHRSLALCLLADNRFPEAAPSLDRLRIRERTTLGRHLEGAWAVASIRLQLPASRAWRFVPLPSSPAAAGDVAVVRDVRLATLLSHHDALAGITLLMRLLRRYARRRTAGGFSHGLALLAFLVSQSERRPSGVRQAQRYRAVARRLADEADEATRSQTLLLDRFLEAHFALRAGRWTEAAALFGAVDEALAALGHGHTLDRLVHGIQRGQALQCLQDPGALHEHVLQLRARFQDGEPRAFVGHIAFLEAHVERLRGRGDAARALLQPWADPTRESVCTLQDAFGACFAALARHGLGASHLDEDLPALRRALQLGRRFGVERRASGHFATGPAALLEATAVRVGHPLARPAEARRLARVTLGGPPGHHAMALRALAWCEDARGRPESALRRLRQAEEAALRHDQQVDVAITRHQIGRRLGGDAGHPLCDDARQRIVHLGASPLLLDEDPGP